jgi:DNA oxidative demethylase
MNSTRPPPLFDEVACGLRRVRCAIDLSAIRVSITAIVDKAPWRQMTVPGGGRMSAKMSNCGQWGWTADQRGYRYTEKDPLSNAAWPALPPQFVQLAIHAAELAGYRNFKPNACLMNLYERGASMGLHQDRNENDVTQPIVSISLGAAMQFLWGGGQRRAAVQRILVQDGDILVWGGAARLNYHGVSKLQSDLFFSNRINLTLRYVAASSRA